MSNESGSQQKSSKCSDTSVAENHVKAKMSLLVLNDYCLEHILQFLSTIEQYQLMKLHFRLQHIVQSYWKLYLKEAHFEELDFMQFTSEDFLDFMIAISPFVERLSLSHLNRRRFQLLEHCSFVRVHTFDCIDPYTLRRCDAERYDDGAISVIRNSFPCLEALQAKGFRITCSQQLFAMRNLKRLQLNFL